MYTYRSMFICNIYFSSLFHLYQIKAVAVVFGGQPSFVSRQLPGTLALLVQKQLLSTDNEYLVIDVENSQKITLYEVAYKASLQHYWWPNAPNKRNMRTVAAYLSLRQNITRAIMILIFTTHKSVIRKLCIFQNHLGTWIYKGRWRHWEFYHVPCLSRQPC